VATFTDPGADTSGEFTASINWGDGSSSTGTVTGSGGTFTVTGSHTYSNTNGLLTTTVTVTEPGAFSASASSTSTATVTETGLTVTGAELESLPLTENSSFSATLGTFTDTGSHTSGDFTASINWGDGSTTSGTVTGSGGTFTVTGSHTYVNTDGLLSTTVTVTQTGAGGRSGSATGTATVSEADLTVTAQTVTATENSTAIVQVATFTDPGADTSGEFTASINWGDGSTSTGTVTGSGGTFTVTGSHLYSNTDGTFTTTVSVTEPGVPGGSALSVGTAKVAEADLTVRASSITATVTSTATVQVATFTDPGTDTSGEFTASINWGDGSSSTGTVTGSNGTFTVTGSHTYTTTGSALPTTVTVTEPGAGSASGSSTATVLPPASGTAKQIVLIGTTSGGGAAQTSPDKGAHSTSGYSIVLKIEDAFGNGVSGVVVTFTAPLQSGASALFTPGNAGSTVVTTNALGEVTVSFKRNAMKGSYQIKATTTSGTPRPTTLTKSIYEQNT
jgi:hypothetical protein